jgi:hypothetical protein
VRLPFGSSARATRAAIGSNLVGGDVMNDRVQAGHMVE